MNNAESVQQVTGLKVTINAFGKHAIDDFEGIVGWEPIKGDFISARVRPSSTISYNEDTVYTIYFTPKHMIPQNGYIEVYIPTEIQIPDKSYT